MAVGRKASSVAPRLAPACSGQAHIIHPRRGSRHTAAGGMMLPDTPSHFAETPPPARIAPALSLITRSYDHGSKRDHEQDGALAGPDAVLQRDTGCKRHGVRVSRAMCAFCFVRHALAGPSPGQNRESSAQQEGCVTPYAGRMSCPALATFGVLLHRLTQSPPLSGCSLATR